MILDEAHIATIAVHPDFRGQGTGGRLLATALAEAIRRRASLATLEVRAGNLAAQQLYHRFHFETAGIRPRYYRDNHEDALIMTVSGLDDSYLHWLESGQWENSELPGL
jgi:ribosomal-protein-alanine N-acetyltransferase